VDLEVDPRERSPQALAEREYVAREARARIEDQRVAIVEVRDLARLAQQGIA